MGTGLIFGDLNGKQKYNHHNDCNNCRSCGRCRRDVSANGKRKIKRIKNNKSDYIPFDGERYRQLIVTASVDVNISPVFDEKQRLETLITLFDKGIITKKQLLQRIPEGMVYDVTTIIDESEQDDNDGI